MPHPSRRPRGGSQELFRARQDQACSEGSQKTIWKYIDVPGRGLAFFSPDWNFLYVGRKLLSFVRVRSAVSTCKTCCFMFAAEFWPGNPYNMIIHVGAPQCGGNDCMPPTMAGSTDFNAIFAGVIASRTSVIGI